MDCASCWVFKVETLQFLDTKQGLFQVTGLLSRMAGFLSSGALYHQNILGFNRWGQEPYKNLSVSLPQECCPKMREKKYSHNRGPLTIGATPYSYGQSMASRSDNVLIILIQILPNCAVQCSTLQCTTLQCTALHFKATHCIVVQCSAVQLSTA